MQSMAMLLTNMLPDILILAFTVFQISKFEPSVPFLEATIDTKDYTFQSPFQTLLCRALLPLWKGLLSLAARQISPVEKSTGDVIVYIEGWSGLHYWSL
jgi:hypothetical protein